MSHVTPDIVRMVLPSRDLIVGVQLTDRDIVIPLTARNLPGICYASAEMIIPSGFVAKTSKEKYVDTSMLFGIGAICVDEVLKFKAGSANISIGFGMDAYTHRDCVASTDIDVNLTTDVTLTERHVASLDISHNVSLDIIPTESSVFTDGDIKVGIGIDSLATVQLSTSNHEHKIGVGLNFEGNVYRQRRLNDLDGKTLADVNNMTLQELYWVERQ